MNCPKCGANDPTGQAEFCSFCYESFKPKAVTKSPTLLFPDVQAEFGYWETIGPLLMTREALYFFVTSCTDVTEKKSLKSKMHNNLMNTGLLGAVVGMATAGAFEEKRPVKPEEVHLKFVHWDQDPLKNYADLQAQIGMSDEYFALEKKEITSITVDVFGHLIIATKTAQVKTMPMEEGDKITGFLRSSGYILK